MGYKINDTIFLAKDFMRILLFTFFTIFFVAFSCASEQEVHQRHSAALSYSAHHNVQPLEQFLLRKNGKLDDEALIATLRKREEADEACCAACCCITGAFAILGGFFVLISKLA